MPGRGVWTFLVNSKKPLKTLGKERNMIRFSLYKDPIGSSEQMD